MAKKFLYFVAACIVIFIIGRIVFERFQDDFYRIALIPSAEFKPTNPLDENAYEDPSLWYSRPGIGVNDPARWQPAWAEGSAPAAEPAAPGQFAVFFVHPTSLIDRNRWNASLDDPDAEAERRARVYLRGMASPFNAASEIWAPRYRQATFGAFLTDAPEGRLAIEAAYQDVREAYRYFLSSVGADTPIVLAGHSQGALHLKRLIAEEVRGSPAADRLVAAYIIGWPISLQHDLPVMGFPACAAANQAGCVLSWSSFAEPADPAAVLKAYAAMPALDGETPGTSPMVCTNPITGQFGGAAEASANLGTLVPDGTLDKGELVAGAVPARCDERGLLLIGDPPKMGAFVLPGNNYHVYDIPLFWANTKADVARRVEAWAAR
ncbi:MAG: hypothetical protein ABS49_07380 [Erythrobacter sp. SCN 62-14]|nr:MAG: hypothetical protein ABS49_07380 [Erythrobacter sp. SCN 62-14]